MPLLNASSAPYSLLVRPSPPGYEIIAERVFDVLHDRFSVDAGNDPQFVVEIVNAYPCAQKGAGYAVIVDTRGRWLIQRGNILFLVWISPALPEGVSV